MDSPEGTSAFTRPDAGESLLQVPRKPPSARTLMDVKDRTPAGLQPFLTFDFEPNLPSRSRDNRNNAGRSISPRNSRVALTHFDPDGMEQLRSRVSLASEYSSTKEESASNNAETCCTGPEGCDMRQLPVNPGPLRQHKGSHPILIKHGAGKSKAPLPSMKANGFFDDEEVAPFNLEMALRETIKQYGSSNASSRTLGLAFKDLSVFGTDRSLVSQTMYQPSVWSSLNPIEWARHLLRLRNRNRTTRRIISGFEGVVHPGEMLLVLGRPEAGCSTLLKALSSHTREYVHLLGERFYDTLRPCDVNGPHRSDVVYFSDGCDHISSLTVHQTISFAAKLGKAGRPPEEIERLTNTFMTIFGLRHAKDLRMGGNDEHALSQVEKRRVQICEVLAAGAHICCWDDVCKELSASASLEFIQALRIATDLSAMTTIVSMNRAGETIYQLFDKVCVVGEGRMYYYGKADAARGYFVDLGYDPFHRQATADFLISATDPLGRVHNPTRPFSVPRVADEFVRAFHRSPLGRENRLELASYWQDIANRKIISGSTDERGLHCRLLFRSSFTTWANGFSAIISRRRQILRNEWFLIVVQVLLSALQGTVAGFTHFHSPVTTTHLVSRDNVLFSAILFTNFSAMVESLCVRPSWFVTLSHYRAAFYHPSTEVLANGIFDIPISLTSQSTFAVAVYLLAGLQESADSLIVFFLIMVTTSLTMKSCFRFIEQLLSSVVDENAVIGISSLLSLLYSDFVVSRYDTARLSFWFSWLDPLRYALEGLMVNEYHARSVPCTDFAADGTEYRGAASINQACLAAGSTSGETYVNGDQYIKAMYDFSYDNLWINIGFISALGVGFFSLLMLVSEWSLPRIGAVFVLFRRGAQECELKTEQPDPYRHIRHKQQNSESNRHNEQFEIPLNDVFAWKNLQYTIPVRKGYKVLLDGISGYIAPRKMCAVIGGSRICKTTLLEILAGRRGNGSLTGDIHLNSLPLPHDYHSEMWVYNLVCRANLLTDDVHFFKQTVREAVRFSADLRQLPIGLQVGKGEYVDSCLRMCGLETYADAMVCTLGIERRKRISICIELAAQPRLLFFLDEPTKGLDSQAALSITALLRDLANHGQAVLCAMDEPSNEILQHFDQVLVLRKGGKMVYFGDIGHDCQNMIKYFEQNGAKPCKSAENPTEWVINTVSADDNAYIPIDWHDRWLRSPDVAKLRREIDEFRSKRQRGAKTMIEHSGHHIATSWCFQMYTLLRRCLTTYWRSPRYLLSKFGLSVSIGLTIGLMYCGSDGSLKGTRSKIFACQLVMMVCIPAACQLQNFFIDVRKIYEARERQSAMYSWTAFLASHLLVELLWNIVSSILLFSAYYWPIGFAPDRLVYSLLVICLIYPFYYTTLALALASPSSSAELSSLLFFIFFSLSNVFDGVIQTSERLAWLKRLRNASPFTYLVEGLVGQALGNQQIECASTEYFSLTPSAGRTCAEYLANFINESGGYVKNPHGSEICLYCPARTTDEYLSSNYNMFYAHRWRNVWIVLGASLINIAVFFGLTYFFRIRRGRLFRLGRRPTVV